MKQMPATQTKIIDSKDKILSSHPTLKKTSPSHFLYAFMLHLHNVCFEKYPPKFCSKYSLDNLLIAAHHNSK